MDSVNALFILWAALSLIVAAPLLLGIVLGTVVRWVGQFVLEKELHPAHWIVYRLGFAKGSAPRYGGEDEAWGDLVIATFVLLFFVGVASIPAIYHGVTLLSWLWFMAHPAALVGLMYLARYATRWIRVLRKVRDVAHVHAGEAGQTALRGAGDPAFR